MEATMIVDLPSTTTEKVNKRLIDLRETGGVVTQGRVLTLVVCTDDGVSTETAIAAANEASREHPCRIIVVAPGGNHAATRLDAQIRVGGDAGASEVVVLRLYGELAEHGDSVVVPFLLPDTPVVVWWPGTAPDKPSDDPIGKLGLRRLTDADAAADPAAVLLLRRDNYAPGDTDLSWARVTYWRALLVAALDQPPFDQVTEATVRGPERAPGLDLMAGWLRQKLNVPVHRETGKIEVRFERESGPIVLAERGKTSATLTRPHQPNQRIALARRELRDCMAEELRRLDSDEIYEIALRGIDPASAASP
jgi:glucose-6-phosphate dehydrogenase assembly protein OpcA